MPARHFQASSCSRPPTARCPIWTSTWTVRLDPLTASLTLTRAGCGGRRSPSGATRAAGSGRQARARWAAAARGLAGRRATGPGGYGREGTPCAAAGRGRRFGEGKLHPPLLRAEEQPGTHVTSLGALLESFSIDICLLQLLRVYLPP